MSTEDWRRRFGAGYWLRVALVSLSAALLLTATFFAAGRGSAVPVMLQHAIVHCVIMAGLCGALMPEIRHRLSTASPLVGWAVTIPSLLGLAAVGTGLACTLITRLGGEGEHFRECFTAGFPINAVLTMTLGVGMSLYEAQRSRLDAVTLELRTRELEHERARKMTLEARLASLESRLQPHFLFNTLNAISSLIQEDPDRAERTVERLAALLRVSLDATGRGLVPLAEELKIVRDYLEIEHTRLGERLAFEIDAPPDVAGWDVPPLAIQTLVENSVKHAVAPRPGGGRIRVEASAVDGRLSVGVWDDGPGFALDGLPSGHGLDNLQGRLAARFGAAATLTVAPRDGGTLITVSVPRTESARR